MKLNEDQYEEAERLVTRLISDASTLYHAASLLKFSSTSDQIADFVNDMAPNFGGVLQKALETQVIVSLARMSDKPGSGRKSRASIRRLKQLVSQAGFEYDFSKVDEF